VLRRDREAEREGKVDKTARVKAEKSRRKEIEKQVQDEMKQKQGNAAHKNNESNSEMSEVGYSVDNK
jgi:hypothetical protein